MTQKNFDEFIAGRRDLFAAGGAAHGHIGSFPMNIFLINGVPTFNIRVYFPENKQERKELKNIYKEHAKNLNERFGKKIRTTVNDLGFAGNISAGKKEINDCYDAFVTAVASELATAGAAPADVCPICKGSRCDSLGLYAGSYGTLHKNCLESTLDSEREKSDQSAEKENYLSGVLGALLGAFAGALPSVLSLWFANTFYGVLYALIPVASFYGYTKLGGKRSKAGVGIIIVTSLLMSTLIIFAIIFIAVLEAKLPISMFWYVVSAPGFLGDIAMDLITSLFFCGLGIAMVWRQITTKPANEDDRRMVRETIIPLQSLGSHAEPKADVTPEI